MSMPPMPRETLQRLILGRLPSSAKDATSG
jgi:hypothetical protein